jgi:hypothetical protein
MELNKLLEFMVNPEKLINPNEIVAVAQELSERISAQQEEIYEREQRVTQEWLKLRETTNSDKMADKLQVGMPEHKGLAEAERLEDRFRRFRSDLKSKLDVIQRTRGF